MKKLAVVTSLLSAAALALPAGCGGSSGAVAPPAATPLAAANVNLIFVASPDLLNQAPGDVDHGTANLTNQGLQRSLLMATYLKQQVLGENNVTSIYALVPMTHLQTPNYYPDMAAIGFIQQFALLNQIALPVDSTGPPYTANSYPINAAYAPGSVPFGVAAPGSYCPNCSGLDYNDTGGVNEALVSGIIGNNSPGYYVFSAPWETINALLGKISSQHGYSLNLPSAFAGPNTVYAISIPPSGQASLVTYNSNLTPPSTYPVLPAPVASAACTNALQPYFSTVRTGGVAGVTIPANTNTNQTTYIIRHADAHPDPATPPDPGNKFEDGNFVGAGQWRALALGNALQGKISPNMVLSIDPAQWYGLGYNNINVAYVRPSLTVMPYVVFNNLPYSLVSNFELGTASTPSVAATSSDYFFTGGTFSSQTILLAWESAHIKPMINALLNSYGVGSLPLLPVVWPAADYDTIWTVTLDAMGNVTVNNALCEGIDSTMLPAAAPQF